MRILITGASGLIGSALIPVLQQSHSIVRMVRSRSTSADEMRWTPGQRLDPALLRDVDAVIHLAGKNIGVRWTTQSKREIVASRVEGTRTIAEAIAESFQRVGKPNSFISASAVGYYGSRGDEVLTESSTSGSGFLAEVVRAWENAGAAATDAGVRTVFPRIGVVLSPEGGALKRMLQPFKLGLGGPIGSGRQWMSWISLTDLVAAFQHAIQTQGLSGAVNLVSPAALTNADFTRELGRALHRPAIIPVPAFAIRLALGEMGEELLLSGSRVVPKKLQESGFVFRHPTLRDALNDLL